MSIAQLPIRPRHHEEPETFGSTPNREGFAQMFAVFQSCGGLAQGRMLDRVFELQGRADRVAPLVLAGQMLAFDWRRARWVPLFQFGGSKLALCRPELPAVLARLKTWCTPWQAAAWLARCHAHMDGQRPMEVLESDPWLVLAAAASDGFIDTVEPVLAPRLEAVHTTRRA
jgi:hypothetical protein